uniref:Uncharacterized protein n=1 Tax=Branchiostoma floridae TaxID=7739 RepID=C3ZX70_BRAFL|eukprot:XP_002586817.1 hypothetical protein BRAFLDRAFT_105569 [Branchiostoma floridae]
MYEQAEPVLFSRPDSGQTSGPPSVPPPVHQGGSRGRVHPFNGAGKSQVAPSYTYEEVEVKRHATYTSAVRSCTSKQSRSFSPALTAAKPAGRRPYLLLSIRVVPAGVSILSTGLASRKLRLHTRTKRSK